MAFFIYLGYLMSKFFENCFSNKYWLNDEGEYHRLDGPAFEWTDGSKAWYINGQYHRIDAPAFEGANGRKEWLINGERHRIDGPAIEQPDEYKWWFFNGKGHRLDGPAKEYISGQKEWHNSNINIDCINGILLLMEWKKIFKKFP